MGLVHDITQYLNDGWQNVVKRRGTPKDPASQDEIKPVNLSVGRQYNAYRGDAIVTKIVAKIVAEALRPGWRMTSPDDDISNVSDEVVRYVGRVGAMEAIRECLILERATGGALAVMGIDDGVEDLSVEVGESVGGLRWVLPFRRDQVLPGPIETDPSSRWFGKRRSFSVPMPSDGGASVSVDVHASRCLHFAGEFAPGETDGWGDSVIDRVWKHVTRFLAVHDASGTATREAARTLYQLHGLGQRLTQEGKESLSARLEAMEMVASIYNVYVMDKDNESITFPTRELNGFPAVLDRAGVVLAAAAGMPITELLGVSPGGLGTGDDEDRRWRDAAADYQVDRIDPKLKRVIEVILSASDGPAAPANWSIQWKPMRQQSEKERSTAQSSWLNAVSKAVEVGIYSPDEAAYSTAGGGEFGYTIQLDEKTRNLLARQSGEPDDDDDDDDDDGTGGGVGGPIGGA